MINGFSLAALNLVTTIDGLRHAVLESIFSDAKAYDWQAERFGNSDHRGWCFESQLNEHGSKIWLLLREKNTPETQATLVGYINKALDWVNEYGRFELITERSLNRINFQLTVHYRNLTIEVESED
ncbi:phage GP46 family protein [Bathymodiolus septemdierum thioautotrophic gill symbiont]|uniref:Phage protein GP46 family protein n=1 Tax=endosymbiont of Bathymodiolus septemdierum str. Myojin knoll TaxID=1303921 RepID=A0A0P0UQZ1_9GAMM|nr:phage GP46 family protein [Bathymodiolus septemdierum thioautotrophic gill symbiont]BAS67626.1 phage protein GP46 family protein [endosymbiont of Bathymodiolus septemdierum str. Myojin knoll]